ncbi:MAG: hypothetical protein QM767_04670 [Anaeromyxobacter sp.]
MAARGAQPLPVTKPLESATAASTLAAEGVAVQTTSKTPACLPSACPT